MSIPLERSLIVAQDAIKEIAEQLKYLPSYAGPDNATARRRFLAARIALAHQLDPFDNSVVVLTNKNAEGQVTGLTVYYSTRALWGKAHEAPDFAGIEGPIEMTDDEKVAWGIEPNIMAFKARPKRGAREYPWAFGVFPWGFGDAKKVKKGVFAMPPKMIAAKRAVHSALSMVAPMGITTLSVGEEVPPPADIPAALEGEDIGAVEAEMFVGGTVIDADLDSVDPIGQVIAKEQGAPTIEETQNPKKEEGETVAPPASPIPFESGDPAFDHLAPPGPLSNVGIALFEKLAESANQAFGPAYYGSAYHARATINNLWGHEPTMGEIMDAIQYDMMVKLLVDYARTQTEKKGLPPKPEPFVPAGEKAKKRYGKRAAEQKPLI